MSRIAAACALLMMALGLSTPAAAKRTVIDGSGQLTLSGYCDVDGADCTPGKLGYTVDFGSGPLSSLLIYGNGILTFGDQVAKFEDYAGNFSNYGVPVVSPGVNPDVGPDSFGFEVLYQSAELTKLPGGVLRARYFYCQGPENCADNYIMTLTPESLGYAVHIDYFSKPVVKINGYAIPGIASKNYFDLRTDFFIPAVFGVIPEPGSWTLMIGGFGLVGAAIRRRDRRDVALAAVPAAA